MPGNTPTDQKRLQQLLRHQLEYLRSSAEDYDQGHHNEAIRMATTMRVLFSSSRKSPGLIFQMTRRNILLTTTVSALPRTGIRQYIGLIGLVMNPDGTGREVVPLDAHVLPEPCKLITQMAVVANGIEIAENSPRKIKASLWTGEPIFVYAPGKAITRRFLFEKAANQDGGAHVDETLDPDYEALHACSDFSFGMSAGFGFTFAMQFRKPVPPDFRADASKTLKNIHCRHFAK